MMDWIKIVRWVHIIAGAAWLGEVLTIIFVIMPAIDRMKLVDRARAIKLIFPRVFRMASFLSLTAVAAGLTMSYLMTGWRELDVLIVSRWGSAILIGGLFGLGLMLFHFVIERRLDSLVDSLGEGASEAQVEHISRYLHIIPRAGVVILILIFLLMMVAARGVP
jgi:uncharacterized membrane protein